MEYCKMLMYFLLGFVIKPAECLDCYQCYGISNITDCHHVVECGVDEYCYTDTTGVGENTRYSLGCRSKQVCIGLAQNSPGALVGRSVNEHVDCSQCCAVDVCNKRMCTMNIHAVGAGHCKDDPEFNCYYTSSLYTLCKDVHHAKLVCRQFCGLCNLVDGQWSAWSSWSNCDRTCGNGTRTRSRRCDNPAPQNKGMSCIGSSIDSEYCKLAVCSGVWETWSSYSSCSLTCGIGIKRRTRNCTGGHCDGKAFEDKPCFLRACEDGGWSSWSAWMPCPVSCDGGLSERYRQCNNPPPSRYGRDCQGQMEEFKVCNAVSCTGIGTDGNWSEWSPWSNCSRSCTRTRTRSCDNPPPSVHGLGCLGDSVEKLNCDLIECAVPVRLVNGSHRYEGRLEVYHNGVWGTVCRDSFTDIEAQIVCGMLNYPIASALAMSAANIYGPGLHQILLDDVSCVGDENNLFDCSHRNWGESDCSHSEDVGVSCITHIHTRLRGGDTHAGRVEVSLDGFTWGTVCNNGFNSDNNGASVVCKMLGYSGQHSYNSDRYKHGTGEIYLSNIACTGSESSLLECDHSVWGAGSDSCDHSQDAGVVCR